MLPAVVLCAALAAGASAAPPALDWTRFSVLTPAGRAEPDLALLRGLSPLVYAPHTFARGEGSAGAVAKACGTTMESLQATNGDELFLISPGAKITVQNKAGLLYRVKGEGEALDDILRRYRRAKGEFDALKGKVIEANGLPGIALLEPYEFQQGDVVLLPGIRMDFDTYRFPFAQAGWHRISSGFSRNRMHPILHYRRPHEGLDLPKPFDTPGYPARSGRVTMTGWHEGYGQMVEIRHTDGWSTRYGHLSKIYVKEGQWVQRGKTLLGRVGNSGLSTGPHLHFEVRDRNGRAINPRSKIGRR